MDTLLTLCLRFIRIHLKALDPNITYGFGWLPALLAEQVLDPDLTSIESPYRDHLFAFRQLESDEEQARSKGFDHYIIRSGRYYQYNKHDGRSRALPYAWVMKQHNHEDWRKPSPHYFRVWIKRSEHERRSKLMFTLEDQGEKEDKKAALKKAGWRRYVLKASRLLDLNGCSILVPKDEEKEEDENNESRKRQKIEVICIDD